MLSTVNSCHYLVHSAVLFLVRMLFFAKEYQMMKGIINYRGRERKEEAPSRIIRELQTNVISMIIY